MVSKEQIVGLVAALEIYSETDPQTRYSMWERKIDYVQNELDEIPNIELEKVPKKADLGKVPHLEIHLDENSLGFTSGEIVSALKSLERPIVLDIGYWENFRTATLFVNPICMRADDEIIVAKELRRILTDKPRLNELLSIQNKIQACAYP